MSEIPKLLILWEKTIWIAVFIFCIGYIASKQWGKNGTAITAVMILYLFLAKIILGSN